MPAEQLNCGKETQHILSELGAGVKEGTCIKQWDECSLRLTSSPCPMRRAVVPQ